MPRKKLKCPRCGRKGSAYRPGVYKCPLGHIFDGDPDEGGTHHDRDPSRRLENQESLEQARAENEARRPGFSRDFRFGGK